MINDARTGVARQRDSARDRVDLERASDGEQHIRLGGSEQLRGR